MYPGYDGCRGEEQSKRKRISDIGVICAEDGYIVAIDIDSGIQKYRARSRVLYLRSVFRVSEKCYVAGSRYIKPGRRSDFLFRQSIFDDRESFSRKIGKFHVLNLEKSAGDMPHYF